MNKVLFILVIIFGCTTNYQEDNLKEVAWLHAIYNYDNCFEQNSSYSESEYRRRMMLCITQGFFIIEGIVPDTLSYNKIFNGLDSTCLGELVIKKDTISFFSQHCNFNNNNSSYRIIHDTERDEFQIIPTTSTSSSYIVYNISFDTGYGSEQNLILNYKYKTYGCIDPVAINCYTQNHFNQHWCDSTAAQIDSMVTIGKISTPDSSNCNY